MQQPLSIKMLVERFGGQIEGDESLMIHAVSTIQSATQGQIAFLDNPKYQNFLAQTQASVVIVSESIKESSRALKWVVQNPKLVFAQVAQYFHPPSKPAVGIHPTAVIAEGCILGERVSIGPFCVLEQGVHLEDDVILESHTHIGRGVRIGSHTRIHPKVVVYQDVKIGSRCNIHSGVIIGSDGFGFANDKGRWIKVPQVGTVVIGNDVEIGANTTIDRGTLEDTIISDGVILDNLIQIGHNVKVGKGTAIAACVGIAGSCTIGAHCMIGGASMFNGHITVADNCYFIPGSQVANSIKKAGVYSSGIPAKERSVWAKNVARFHHLDELAHKVRALERRFQNSQSVVEEPKS